MVCWLALFVLLVSMAFLSKEKHRDQIARQCTTNGDFQSLAPVFCRYDHLCSRLYHFRIIWLNGVWINLKYFIDVVNAPLNSLVASPLSHHPLSWKFWRCFGSSVS